MKATFWSSSIENGVETVKSENLGPGIDIRITALGSERTKILARCTQPIFNSYFQILLEDIAANFPIEPEPINVQPQPAPQETIITKQVEKNETEDEREDRLARLAHTYSQKGEGGVNLNSMKLWEQIKGLKEKHLSDSIIIKRLALDESKYKYHKNKMKKTGYWSDMNLENLNN